VTPALLAMTVEELTDAVQQLGHPAYRARQLADWVYAKAVTDPAAMTNLPKALAQGFDILTSRVVARADGRDGTIKLLIELADGERIECVMMPSPKRVTACLSTQVGCSMACVFCASGMEGLRRNLSAGEILEQILHLSQACKRRITNAVFMGVGEPLANYDATIAAVRALVDPQRFNISARHVTVSTVGLPKKIRRLAREGLPITLAISLHAPNDALRKQLLPTAGGTPIADILAAAQEFFEAHKREITIEYVLLGGVNDSMVCADALAKLARTIRCNVNLIRFNPVDPSTLVPPTIATVKAFAQRLGKRGVNVHVRRPRGRDVAAACGQLRRNRPLQSDSR